MAETLGSLCDKLTIVKLKQWHTEDKSRLASLSNQEQQLTQEIDHYVNAAIHGLTPLDKLSFPANKVYAENFKLKIDLDNMTSLGNVFSQLSTVNCALWHEQEKVYHFDDLLVDEKNHIVKQLACLNLERNNYIDQIDRLFTDFIKSHHHLLREGM